MITGLRWQLRTPLGAVDVGTHGCWEEHGQPLDDPGPYTYECRLPPVDLTAGECALLRFGAVSYACTVAIDGVEVANHRGMWDAFMIDITEQVADCRAHTVTVETEKPASLTHGPDSTTVPGNYPTREVLTGFLPYVWGHSCGGIWQPVQLEIVPADGVVRLEAHAEASDRIMVEVTTPRPTRLGLVINDAEGVPVVSDEIATEASSSTRATGRTTLAVAEPRHWRPSSPHLYRVQVRNGNARTLATQPVGMRSVGVTATGHAQLQLSGRPIYPRLALSWGWYPDRLMPNPGPERVREDLKRLRAMGFNGVKLCLWFPPDFYFDLADEFGMLLWVELPLWLPHPSPGFAQQASKEITALVRQARRHPSVIIYSLGCELGANVEAPFLQALWTGVKQLAADALVCDNSGSGEAYGGADEVCADFYDHHLYAELNHLRSVFDYFSPGWRPRKPWLLGEFCDYDTFRIADGQPWWASPDPKINPQGARWQYDAAWFADRVAREGWTKHAERLRQLSQHRAMLHRKFTIEYVRSRPDVSGFVITGERDTPISTSGMLDDAGDPKESAEAIASFNSDPVLLVAPVRRRRWVAGGDRPAPPDHWCHPAGGMLRLNLLLATTQVARPRAIRWRLFARRSIDPISSGTVNPPRSAELGAAVTPLGSLSVPLPDRPGPVELVVETELAGQRIGNSWTYWVMPTDPWSTVGQFSVADPSQRFDDLPTALAMRIETIDQAPEDRPLLASRWSAELDAWVQAGGHAMVTLDQAADSPYPLLPMPFWRESVIVIEAHPAWNGFPHDGHVDLQFFGMAPDVAMNLGHRLNGRHPDDWQHLLRRVDTRTGETHDYASLQQRGAGRILFTTLRFEGGLGSQPIGLSHNISGSALLASWLAHLTHQVGPTQNRPA